MRNLFTVKTRFADGDLVTYKSNHCGVRGVEVSAPSQSVIGEKTMVYSVLRNYVTVSGATHTASSSSPVNVQSMKKIWRIELHRTKLARGSTARE
jgi:hypothetical protein